LKDNLSRYAGKRNEPSAHATSGMSPYLHFGQISSLEIALAVKEYAASPTGARKIWRSIWEKHLKDKARSGIFRAAARARGKLR
jgi:deoxyribodipyrimidine photolyase